MKAQQCGSARENRFVVAVEKKVKLYMDVLTLLTGSVTLYL